MKKISILTPCFNEENNLIDCCEQIEKIFLNELKDYDYEHIIVDNNSNNETIKILRKLSSGNKKIKIIFNNKNYGVVKSCFNGIKYCSGDAVIPFFPADLQDPPSLIIEFVRKWREGYDFVVGIRKTRQEFFIMRWVRNIFYFIIVILSGKQLYYGISDYQIVDKKIINEIKEINNFVPFARTLPFNYSDNYTYLNYEWKKRIGGKPKDGIITYIATAINAILYVTSAPFRVLLYVGVLSSALSFLYIVNVLINYFTVGTQAAPGITLLIILVLILISLNFLIFCFIGEYIVNIFNMNTKNQKIIVKEKINF